MARSSPLSDKITAALKAEVIAGKWVGVSLPSEREISEKYGVARVTARKSLQQLCVERLLESRPGRGYFMAPGVASLRPQAQGRAVLFFFVDSTGQMLLDPMDTAIVNGASAEARRHGVEVYSTCQEPAVFRRIIRERKGKDLRGVLLDWARPDLAEIMFEEDVPFVVVEDDLEGLPVAAVIQDNAGGVGLGLEHITSHGHRRIGLIVGSHESVHPAQRLSGYREFMLRTGLELSPELVAREAPEEKGGGTSAAALLDLPERPTAIFIANRGSLGGVLAEMAERGLKCPEDVSLVVWGEPGSDGVLEDANETTYVTWDRAEMGRMAMLLLEERIRVGRAERTVCRVEPRLVERGSVAKPADEGR
jgi:DNA-binding LacI/PurR family transcriptional regulator